jgi:hypothetical protein
MISAMPLVMRPMILSVMSIPLLSGIAVFEITAG